MALRTVRNMSPVVPGFRAELMEQDILGEVYKAFSLFGPWSKVGQLMV